jgi:hypothetical protein
MIQSECKLFYSLFRFWPNIIIFAKPNRLDLLFMSKRRYLRQEQAISLRLYVVYRTELSENTDELAFQICTRTQLKSKRTIIDPLQRPQQPLSSANDIGNN